MRGARKRFYELAMVVLFCAQLDPRSLPRRESFSWSAPVPPDSYAPKD